MESWRDLIRKNEVLYWKLAFRNLFRQRGRLFLNLLLLVGAFCTITSFKGFKNHILLTIQNLVIDTQYGHIQVAQKSFWNNTAIDQVTDRMFNNYADLVQKISQIDGVQFVSPRLSFFGMINTEDYSTTALFIGIQPEVENKIQNNLVFLEGEEFNKPKQIVISSGLQPKLKVKNNDQVTVVAPTLLGGINAMDLTIKGIFSSGITEIDNGTIFLNLNNAQKVLDSTYVDQLIIKLRNENDTPRILPQIRNILKGTQLEAKTWKELAELFNQVENFYLFQNIFIEVILLLLLFLSVTNTMTMSVFERLREIGTLRALGDNETDIQRLFFIESFLLGCLAICLGIPSSMILISILNSFKILITLPMASQPILFTLAPTFGSYLEASLACLLSVIVAGLWPVYKGSKTSIVSALGAKL